MPVRIDELLATPVSSLSTKQQNDAWFDGTAFMHDFGDKVMKPLLSSQFNLSQQEKAVIETYYRVWLMLGDMVKLNHRNHFQTVASIARSLFELWIDLELIAKDTTGKSAADYYEYAELERFRRAKEIVDFETAHPGQLGYDVSPQRAFYTDPARQNKFAQERSNHWAGRLPKRAKLAGQEAFYIQAYPMLSWYAHAGGAGISGISADGLERVFGYSHGVAQRAFLQATLTCARLLKISQLDYFDRWGRDMLTKTAQLITVQQIRQLEEAQRQAGLATHPIAPPPAAATGHGSTAR